jgi:very-short-patch-repair endonuclease
MDERRGEVLVAILNNPFDLVLAREEHWYRIPVSSVKKWLKDRWPPRWLAFYQTKIFVSEAHAVNYYARVKSIRKVRRQQLFPDEHHPTKAQKRYYQVMLEPLEKLGKPILSRRYRRIVFIPTTWRKFSNAVEINDLFDESPLEDRLWAEFKRMQITAERQEYVSIEDRNYALDFAIYCAGGKIDVETDGDLWHANPERSEQDNLRDNDLKTIGWKVLRFNSRQIREQLETYTVPVISENINRLGGVEEGRVVPRKVDPDAPDGTSQPTLFDDL